MKFLQVNQVTIAGETERVVLWDRAEHEQAVAETRRALKGRRAHQQAARRATESRRGPKAGDPTQISRQVQDLHRQLPLLAWTDVCRRVGQRRGISGRTVRRYTESVRW